MNWEWEKAKINDVILIDYYWNSDVLSLIIHITDINDTMLYVDDIVDFTYGKPEKEWNFNITALKGIKFKNHLFNSDEPEKTLKEKYPEYLL